MKKLFIALIVFMSCVSHGEEIAIIVHPNNNSEFTPDNIAKMFLGREKSFSNGEKIVPVTLDSSSELNSHFAKKVFDRSPKQLKAYWSKLTFTGKGKAPKKIDNSEEVLALISSDQNAIGWVEKSKVSDKVKVVNSY